MFIKREASYYSVFIDIIYRIWRQTKKTSDACHKKTKRNGWKRIQIDFEKVSDILLTKCGTLWSLQRV